MHACSITALVSTYYYMYHAFKQEIYLRIQSEEHEIDNQKPENNIKIDNCKTGQGVV